MAILRRRRDSENLNNEEVNPIADAIKSGAAIAAAVIIALFLIFNSFYQV